jgi:hypothetical protein
LGIIFMTPLAVAIASPGVAVFLYLSPLAGCADVGEGRTNRVEATQGDGGECRKRCGHYCGLFGGNLLRPHTSQFKEGGIGKIGNYEQKKPI